MRDGMNEKERENMGISDLFIILAMLVVSGLLGWFIAWIESFPQ